MTDLDKALGDIHSIRREMARTTQFRGYGPATLAATGAFALAAAIAQAVWIREPATHLRTWLTLWLLTATLSALLTGAQMYTRTRRIHSGLSDEMLHQAVEQFLPALGAGVLITLALTLYVPEVAWMLPGLWQIIFSLGIFSSCRFLPQPMLAAGAWYMLTGMVSITLGTPRALSPWTMGIAFGVGQLLVAAILFLTTSEASDES